MDREQEVMQFLGLWGIYTETYKIIISWRKISSQITLPLILPLSFIFLFHIEVSDLLLRNIIHTEIILDDTQPGTQKYDKISDDRSSERTFWFFKAADLTLLLIFSLLSTSAVVYTIACIYTAREVTFKKVMNVIPKVWKRLMVTFLCVFVAFLAYHFVAILTFIWVLVNRPMSIFGVESFQFLLIFYLVGLACMSMVWQLASTVFVLEDVYGMKAMIKSNALLKGKMWVATIIIFKSYFFLAIIQFAFRKLVVHGESLGMGNRMCYGIVCFLLLFKLILFTLVIHTVIYFLCKSYHHENIDKSILSDHLEVYLGEYVSLKAKDVQLEHVNV